jgi:hypothetical protein
MSRRYERPTIGPRNHDEMLLEAPLFLADGEPIGLPWGEGDYMDWPWGRIGACVSVLIAIGLFYVFLGNTDKPHVLVFALLAANAAPHFWAASDYRPGEAKEHGRIRKILEALTIHGQVIFVELAWQRIPEGWRDDLFWGLSAVLVVTLTWQLVDLMAVKPRRRMAAQALANRDVFPRL